MDNKNIESLLGQAKLLFLPSNRALLSIEGPDAKDFLHRMSTNDLRILHPGSSISTCFVSPKGRTVDFILVIEHQAGKLSLISSFSDAQKLRAWLLAYQFVEDFSLEVLETKSWIIISSPDIEPSNSHVLWHDPRAKLKAKIWFSLSPCEGIELSKESFEHIRIASHMPAAPNEINENYMPQNINLAHTIADNKGCYLGQEVLAKALIYQKNTKMLTPISLSPEKFKQAALGMAIEDSEGRPGHISSLAPNFWPDWPQALAIVNKM